MPSYDDVDILLVSFSIVERNSFNNVRYKWYKEIQKYKKKFKDTKVRETFLTSYITTLENISLQIVLIGTNADLKNDLKIKNDEKISKVEAQNLAKEINAVGYVETSAKTGEGVKEAVQMGLKAL